MVERAASFIARVEGFGSCEKARRGIVAALKCAGSDAALLLTPQILAQWHAILLQFCDNSRIGGRRRDTAAYRCAVPTFVDCSGNAVSEFYLDHWQIDAHLLTFCDYVNTFIVTDTCPITRTRSRYDACVWYYRVLLLIHPFPDGNGRLAWTFFYWFFGCTPAASWVQPEHLCSILWACRPHDGAVFSTIFDWDLLFNFFHGIQ